MRRFTSNVRLWSNRELVRALEPLKPHEMVINVSGHQDRDKQGGHYRDYFRTEGYDVSYYSSDQVEGLGVAGSIPLDLMSPLPDEYVGKYDLAFNHTVLEHVPNPFFAFEQIAKLSRDLVLTVVPFRQQVHFSPGHYGDYFRFSPMAMRYLHELNGIETLFESHTPSPAGEFYVVSLGTKRLASHAEYPRVLPELDSMNGTVGRHGFRDSLSHVIHRVLEKLYLRSDT